MSDKPTIAGTSPIKVDLEAGKKYAWCSCGLSTNQPFCDGSHKETNFVPTVWECKEDSTVHLCTCKQTDRENGLCNGAHKSLMA